MKKLLVAVALVGGVMAFGAGALAEEPATTPASQPSADSGSTNAPKSDAAKPAGDQQPADPAKPAEPAPSGDSNSK